MTNDQDVIDRQTKSMTEIVFRDCDRVSAELDRDSHWVVGGGRQVNSEGISYLLAGELGMYGKPIGYDVISL